MGDEAIMFGLLKLIRDALPSSNVTIQTYDPDLYNNPEAAKISYAIYGWTVFENKNFFIRFFRISQLFILYWSIKLRLPFFRKNKLASIVDEYRKADMIIFAGGGYLRTRAGLTQLLNLIMQLSMFWFANLFDKPRIVAPISFGPFHSKWHGKLAARALKKMNIVFAREEKSGQYMNEEGVNAEVVPDMAFFLPEAQPDLNKGKILGITMIELLGRRQAIFEKNYIVALGKFAITHGYKIQPLIHVDAAKYGISDVPATQRIIKSLEDLGVETLPIINTRSIKELMSHYSKLDIFLGMRMHSDIIAATQLIPFVAIAYEHKTEGVCKALGLSDFCIGVDEVDTETLLKLLNNLVKDKAQIKEKLLSFQKTVDSVWKPKFSEVLKSYAN